MKKIGLLLLTAVLATVLLVAASLPQITVSAQDAGVTVTITYINKCGDTPSNELCPTATPSNPSATLAPGATQAPGGDNGSGNGNTGGTGNDGHGDGYYNFGNGVIRILQNGNVNLFCNTEDGKTSIVAYLDGVEVARKQLPFEVNKTGEIFEWSNNVIISRPSEGVYQANVKSVTLQGEEKNTAYKIIDCKPAS